MVDNNDFATKFEIDGSDGRAELQRIFGDLKKLIPAAKQAGDAVDASAGDMAKQYTQVASAIERVEMMMDRLQASAARRKSAVNVADANDASATSKYVYGDDANKSKAAAAAQKVLNLQTAQEVTLRQQANRDLADEQRRLLVNAQIEEVSNRTRIADLREIDRAQRQMAADEQRAQALALKAQQAQKAAVLDRARTERSAAGSTAAAQRAAANPGTERTSALANERTASLHDVSQINATRYALYDVAATAAIVGTAIAGIGGSAIVAATQAESSFAQVQRAMDDTGAESMALRANLLELTTDMPTSFEDVAGVAQLGAQLGIANQDLDDFSATVTKFSATTNVSVDATATSFGKLGNLLKVPAAEYENLGSSIYQVGIKSAATETEILSMSQQLAGAASAYGFTASSVVGLSSSFASLGIAPEAARGSVTRLFGDIESGAAKGGRAMEPFADLLGKTTEEATALWKSDPSQFFNELVKGLAEAQKQGNLLQSIQSIGANDVRDVNLLQRLATNSSFLTEQLQIANKAYSDGTALSKGYETVASTLAAKLTELWNTLQKLAITAGGPFLGAIGGVVDFLKVLLNQLADANPVVLGVITLLSLLVGGFVLLRAAQATVLAGILALRFVLQQLGDSSNGTGVKIASLRTQLGLLRAELTGTAVSARGAAVGMEVTGAAASTAGKGMAAFGLASKAIGWAGLILLVGQFAGALLEANKASISAWQGINKVSTAAQGAKLSVKEVADSFTQAKQQIYEFDGGNLTDKLANAFGSAFGVNDYVKQAQDEIKAVDDRLAKMAANGNGDDAAKQVQALGISANEIERFLPNYSAALDAASEAQDDNGKSATVAGQDLESYSTALESAKQSVDELFGSLNQGSDFGSAIQTLFSGIYDAGNAFGYLNETGRTNLANLQDAMVQTAAYASSTGANVTDSLALVFYQLQQSGVDTAGLLQLISSQPYVFSADLDVTAFMAKVKALTGGGSSYSTAIKTMDAPTRSLGLNLGNLAVSAPRAASGIDKTKKAAKEAAKEVVTLSDYASDLNTVFSDATQYRFGVSDALDDISSQWKDITDKIAENNKAVAENKKKNKESFAEYKQDIKDTRIELAKYRADLAGLKADLAQKRYFLKIAVQYGDNLRGDAIKADIAGVNADIADKSNDIAKAQKELKTPFEATTVSIDKQKASLGDLYRSYQDAIVEYARSGMSQEELSRKTEALRQDFIRQATQAGYSKAQINKYSGAFDDLTYAIRNVPRKITVAANTNPAVQALNDFLAKANKSKATPTVSADGGKTYQNGVQAGQKLGDGVNVGLKQRLNSASVTMELETKFGKGQAVAKSWVGGVTFADGGFVPGSTPADRRKDNMLGVISGGGVVGLQGGEPIINNAARSKYGDDMFQAINSLNYQPNVIRPQVTVQGGGGYDGPVELSAYDRSMLAAIISAVQQGLTIDSSAVQNAANGANVVDSKRRRG